MANNEEILAIARKRFQSIQTAESHIREAAIEDIKFAYNIEDGQWPASIREEREKDKRPCLTINKLRKFVAQVANRERDARMSIRVRPVDDKSDPEVARILEGLIRNIEYQSGADEIYARAGENAITGGFGYWRILHGYKDDSFDQEIWIEHIENPFSVYLDPKGKYCFIRESLTKEDFKAQYPNSEFNPDFDYAGLGEEYELWYEDEKVFIADYYYQEPYEKEIALVDDGKIYEITEEITVEKLKKEGHTVHQTRTVRSHRVMYCKMAGNEILEGPHDTKCKYIPIVEVEGDKINIQGKTYKRSLIRDAKDAQRAYNYWLTTMTETVALAPKAPYIVTPQMLKGHEAQWKEANRKNFPYLYFNPQGNLVPRREPPPTVPTGALQLLTIADNDIKDAIGIFEPSLGARGVERSGRAIIARTQRSDIGIFHFPDNLRRAIIKTGRILIDLIPKIYDTERTIRIRGYNEIEETVTINKAITTATAEGIKTVIVNDLSMGKYDVVADVGVYSTRRQESVEMMIQTLQYAPAVAPLILDLVFKYSDWPGASEIEERIKQFLPRLIPGEERGRIGGERERI